MNTVFLFRRVAVPLAIASLALSGVGVASAASITYNLNRSSDDLTHISGTGFVTGNLPNGPTYATVTIDDEGAPGLINFTVAVSAFWAGKMDSGFGIDSFGFNVLPPEAANGLVAAHIINLPSGAWSAAVDYSLPNPIGIAQDGFGRFDAVVSTNSAANRVSPSLTFSINNTVSVDTIADYIAGSIAGSNGSHFFAVHIAGVIDQNPLAPVAGCPAIPDANIEACNLLTSAWFAGSTTVVPVPAAVWMFGSGLALLGFARRRAA